LMQHLQQLLQWWQVQLQYFLVVVVVVQT